MSSRTCGYDSSIIFFALRFDSRSRRYFYIYKLLTLTQEGSGAETSNVISVLFLFAVKNKDGIETGPGF